MRVRLSVPVPLQGMLPSFWVASTKRCKDAGSPHSPKPMGATEDASSALVIAGQEPDYISCRGTTRPDGGGREARPSEDASPARAVRA